MLAAAEKVNVMLELYTADEIPVPVFVPALQLGPSSGTAGGTLGADEPGTPVALVKLSWVNVSVVKLTLFEYRCNTKLVAGLKLTMYSRSLFSPASGTTIGILNLAFLSYISSRVQKWLF